MCSNCLLVLVLYKPFEAITTSILPHCGAGLSEQSLKGDQFFCDNSPQIVVLLYIVESCS